MQILVTGASGYIGRQLVPALLAQGHTVRALSRDATRAAASLPAGVETVQGDVLEYDSLLPALAGVEVAYYLVHSLGDEGKARFHGDFDLPFVVLTDPANREIRDQLLEMETGTRELEFTDDEAEELF